MKSIFFISTLNNDAWGGSEMLWYKTALFARANGYKVGVAVYYWQRKQPYVLALRNAGCLVYELPNIDTVEKNALQKFWLKTYYKLRQFIVVCKLPLKDYDVVVINQSGFKDVVKGVWKYVYKKAPNYSLLFHSYSEQYRFKPRRANTLKEWVNNARHNLFAADRIRIVVEQQAGLTVPNAGVLFNPVNLDVPKERTTYPEIIDGHYVFSIVAALDIGFKAQERMIETLSSEKWKQRNWTLHLYGEGKDKALLENLIEEKGLKDRVLLKGHITNVKSVLQQTHLLLQVTRQDAMPLSVVEAMAMSRPLVVSRLGDMPVWVKENENGFIAESVDIVDIDVAMDAAWSRKEDWSKMGSRSFEIFKEKFPESPERYFLQQVFEA